MNANGKLKKLIPILCLFLIASGSAAIISYYWQATASGTVVQSISSTSPTELTCIGEYYDNDVNRSCTTFSLDNASNLEITPHFEIQLNDPAVTCFIEGNGETPIPANGTNNYEIKCSVEKLWVGDFNMTITVT